MTVTRTVSLWIEVGGAPGQGATIHVELDGKSHIKSMHPAAWKKAWEHFGGSQGSNEATKRRVEEWLGNVLRPDDLTTPVLDVLWVTNRLPPTI